MRLLTKTSLLIITISIFIFLVGNIVFFNVSKQMINKHVDTELIYQMHKAIKEIKTDGPDMGLSRFSDDVVIKQINFAIQINPTFSDTVLYSNIQKKFVPHRALAFTFPHKDRNYMIVIYKSLLSSDKLIERITFASILMFLIFAVIIYVMNQFVFGKVWSNFFSNLNRVENYDIKGHLKLELEESEIAEFSKLNNVLISMVNRIQGDFENLKELTANTSHEIQTPLAIIKSKAELLLQSPNFTENEMNAIGSILNTTERLSKLNQSLLLITKIENDQYGDSIDINVAAILEKLKTNFEMVFQDVKFNLQLTQSDLEIRANSVLLEILISNLLKNAIIHGGPEGEVTVALQQNIFAIKNKGKALKFSPDDIFIRFVKGSKDKNSSGLGLAIVKKICDYYNLPIQYNYLDEEHSFSIDFSKISIKN